MEPKPEYRCVIFAEDDFDGVHGFNTFAEMEAFCLGAEVAANLYGAGKCVGVRSTDSQKMVVDEFGEKMAARILKALEV